MLLNVILGYFHTQLQASKTCCCLCVTYNFVCKIIFYKQVVFLGTAHLARYTITIYT